MTQTGNKELKIEFVRHGDGYRIELPEQTLNIILGVINTLSLGEQSKFSYPLNIDLENRLIARVVTSNFMLDDTVDGYKAREFVKIHVVLPDREFDISTAIIHTSETEYEVVYGLIYDN